MLISHAYEFIYLKTRKTAGTSVEMALQPWCFGNEGGEVEERTHAIVTLQGAVGRRLVKEPDREPADGALFNHLPASKVRKMVGPRIWSRYRKILVLRNPFDRAVSAFHWQQDLSQVYGAESQPQPIEDTNFDEVRAAFRAYILAAKWKTDAATVLVNGRFCGDLVIHYESLAADLADVARTLGIDPGLVRLPVTKNSKAFRRGQPVAAYFDAETIQVVRDRMDWAFKAGGYGPLPSETPPPVTGAEPLPPPASNPRPPFSDMDAH